MFEYKIFTFSPRLGKTENAFLNEIGAEGFDIFQVMFGNLGAVYFYAKRALREQSRDGDNSQGGIAS